MVFDHTPPTPNLNYGLFTQNFFTLFFENVNMIKTFQNGFQAKKKYFQNFDPQIQVTC